ncbi:RNA polymerase sigma factor [Bacillus sp. BGMRC 2118]|nr:RNA polymerase sigma factor [Bacillus sp. BGMRC 2118]
MDSPNSKEQYIIEIYDKYYLYVYRFLICFSGNRNDAEDMTQEVFIRVLNNLSDLNRANNIKTWILSIAKHIAIDHYRKKRFSTIFSEGFFKQIKGKSKDPNDEIQENEMKTILHKAISNLKPYLRAVVILRGINELSIKEASDILQCSETKVKVDYHRALKILKTKLHIDVEEVI